MLLYERLVDTVNTEMVHFVLEPNQGECGVGSMEGGADFILHPLIHTSAHSELGTKYGSCFQRGKVWIKV
jgi:hypothetical protein